MKQIFYRRLAVALSLLLLCSCSASSSKSSLVGKYVPSTRIQMMSGEYLPLEEFRGKTLILTFWATWCSRSNQTLGEIGEIAQRFQSRPDLVFLNVSVDKSESIEKVRTRLSAPSLAATKNAFSGNAEYDEAFRTFRCNDVPRIFIINPVGMVVAEGTDAKMVAEYLQRP